LHRIALAKPFLKDFPLRGLDNTPPFHRTSALTVLSHYVRTLIENMDHTVRA
jgi:hypothetical protein